MAIDRKWYKKSGLKLPSGDLFRIIAVWFDVTLTLSVVASKRNNDQTAQTACYILLSVVFFLVSTALLILKTGIICKSIQECTEDADKYWKYLVATLDSVLGMAVIVMGTAYLFGENLPSSLCSGDHCRQVKTGLLGGSLIGNLFLTVVEKGFDWSGGWDKFKTIDDRQKQWADLLGLLSVVVLFDQALTGFFMTVYDIRINSTDLTCDSNTNGWSAGAYSLSVVLFILLIVFITYKKYFIESCRTKLQGVHDKANAGGTNDSINAGGTNDSINAGGTNDSINAGGTIDSINSGGTNDGVNSGRWKCICCGPNNIHFMCVGISLINFFIIYIFADLPWPWNCKGMINLQEAKTARLALLIISFIFVSVFLGLYFFIVCIPSAHAFHQAGRKSVVYNSKIKKLFGAQFRGVNTKISDDCKYEDDNMKIKMQGDLKADQTTLSLPLSFQFERDTECSLWCQAYDCCSCTRQCRDVVEDRVPHTEGNNSENSFLRTLASLTEGNSYQTVPQQCASNTAESHKLNVGSVLFATPKKEATVLFIDEACNREDLMRMLSQDTSDVIIHSFSDSNEESNATPQRLETT